VGRDTEETQEEKNEMSLRPRKKRRKPQVSTKGYTTRSKVEWSGGSITIKTMVQTYRDRDIVTYEYTVRRGREILERNRTSDLEHVLRRIDYFKGLGEKK